MPERSRNIPPDEPGKDPSAVDLGRRGGRKGGRARANRMSPTERSESARHAARARWDLAGNEAAAGKGDGSERSPMDERLRAAFIAGAEEHSRIARGRGLTPEEVEGVLERFRTE